MKFSMHSLSYSASPLFLAAVVFLLSLSTNITPRANAMIIVRARSPVSNDVAVDRRAIEAEAPFDSNGTKQRDGIFGPEPDQEVVAIIPRFFISPFLGRKPRNRRPKLKDPEQNTRKEDVPGDDAPKTVTQEEDLFGEDPPQTPKNGKQRKKRPTPNKPKNCEDGGLQNPGPCPTKNKEPPA